MDIETLAVAMIKALPKAGSGDSGSVLVVDSNGKWVKGQPVSATISVSDTTLVVTSE